MAINTGQSRAGWHRISVFQECPQKFSYEYELKLKQEKKVEELCLGTQVHLALAHRYAKLLGQSDRDPLDALGDDSSMLFVRDRATEIYQVYDKKWQQFDFAPVDVEKEFEVSVNGEPYTQRVDLVAEIGGKIVFVDHKTYGMKKQDWGKVGQFIGLNILGRQLAPELYKKPFGGVWVNEICTRKPVCAKGFTRSKVEIPSELIDKFIGEIGRTYGVMAAYKATLDPWQYPKNFSACAGKYRCCDHWDKCVGGKK